MVHALITALAFVIVAVPALAQAKDKPPAANPKVEPTGGRSLPQTAPLRDRAVRLRQDAEAFSQHASSSLRNADTVLKSIRSGDAALRELGGNPAFATAVADIKTSIAKQQETAAKHQASAKADQEQAARLLAQAQDLEKQAGALEKPAPAPPPATTKAPLPAAAKPGTKAPGKG